jgi:hypothetical protein
MNNKNVFVTAIYNNLDGTIYGGRNRKNHYNWSLMSLLKMTNANFVCYTSQNDYDELLYFFHDKNKIDREQLKIKIFELENNNFNGLISKWKNYEDAKTSDRCIEIQYMKFIWSLNEIKNYENVFWIDAGLSHCGIIPNKYLTIIHSHENRQYYESNLFDDIFVEKLLEKAKDKFLIVAKENERNYWSGTVNEKHFNQYNNSKHIIGGLFGGKSELWNDVVELFSKYVYRATEEDGRLYHEEDIMTLMYRNHEDFFNTLEFDVWWHENNLTDGLPEDYLIVNKSFYKILEEMR